MAFKRWSILKTGQLLAWALCAQLILPYPLFAHALQTQTQTKPASAASVPGAARTINLDLSSVTATTGAGVLNLARSLIINVGGKNLVVGQSTVLTPAELVAAYQVSATGVQTLSLAAAGNAIGGRFSLTGLLSQSIGNLLIPQHVKLVQDFASMPLLDLSGDLTNAGKLIAISSNARITSATIDAANIYNQQGALLTSVLPSAGFATLVPSLHLSLNALGDIINAGTIASSGNLTVCAGGRIVNALSNVANGPAPTMQAANDINLESANLVNGGVISALTGNVNISSANTPNLTIANTGGTISALSGNINVLNSFAAPSTSAQTVMTGGNYLSQSLNIDTGAGKLTANIDQVTGWVNVNAGCASFGASTTNLKLGNLNVTGDPTYFNAAGSLTLSNIAPTGGYDLALLAEGDVIVTGGAINTVQQESGSGGNITIIAGANITAANNVVSGSNNTTSVVTVNGPSATGGAIDLSGASIVDAHASYVASGAQGNGGNILLVAYAGSGQGSNYVPGTINAGTIDGMASYTQAPKGGNYSDGDITIIAGATEVPNGQSAVQLNSALSAAYGISAGAGAINIYEATPSGQITVQNGTIISGAITPGALQAVSLGTAGAPVTTDFTGQLRIFTAGNVYINSGNALNLGPAIFGAVFQVTSSGSVNITGNIVGSAVNSLVSITSNLYSPGGAPPILPVGIFQSGQTFISAANVSLISDGDINSAFNATGDVLIQSQGSVTLQSSAAGGTIQVLAGQNLTVLGSLSAGSSLSLTGGVSAASSMQIAPSANIQSGGGLTIQNNDTNTGSIVIGNGASLSAVGQITISIGDIVSLSAGTAPSSVTVNEENGGLVFFGNQGIVAAQQQNTITADTNNVVFNINSATLTASAISLGGGVQINSNSTGNSSYGCACGVVLNSLDLSNPTVVSQIVELQASDPSQVGGTLIVTNGVATGGNLILTAAVNLANLSAEVIPANVTVQFSGFKIDPINVNITAASSAQQVVVNGSEQFISSSGVSNGLITITNTQDGNALAVNGSLTSDGSLNVVAQGSISSSGTMTAGGTNMSLTMTRGSLRVPVVTAENPLVPSALIQTGGTISAANEIDIIGDGLSQTGGQVTAATVAIQVTGSVGAVNMPVSVSANNLSVNAGGLYVFVTNPSGATNLLPSASGDYFVLSSFGTITVSGNLQAVQTQLIALPGSNGSIAINNAVGAIGGSAPQWTPTLALAADGTGSIVVSQANLLQVSALSLTTGVSDIGSQANYFTTNVSNLTVNSGGDVFINNTVPTSVILNPTGNPSCDIASASVLGNLTITNDQILNITGPVYVSGALSLSSGSIGTGNTLGSPVYIAAGSVNWQAVIGPRSPTWDGITIGFNTTINSAGALTIESNDTNSGYINIDSGASLFSNGLTVFTIGDLPVEPVNGKVPANVTVKQLNGGQVYFSAQGITAGAPANVVTADTNDVIFNVDRLGAGSFSSITIGGGVTINSHSGSPAIVTQPSSFASLDLTDPVVANQIVRLQQAHLLAGTLILLYGYAVGGTVTITSAIDLSQLSAFNIPANVGVTFQNFQANNPININFMVQAPANLESINGQIFFQGVENFASTQGPSNVVINISSLNKSSPALYLSGNLTSDGSLTITVNGDIQTGGVIGVAGDLTLKTAPGSNGAIDLVGTQTSGGTTIISTDGSGAIMQANIGNPEINLVSGSTVSLNSVNGGIGITINSGSEGGAINVSASNLTIATVTGSAFVNVIGSSNLAVSAAGGSATVTGTASVNLNSSTVGQGLNVTAANNISVNGNLATGIGALSLTAGNSGEGTIEIAPMVSLVSTGGALTIEDNDTVSGAISIGSGATLFANGQVAVVIGGVPVSPTSGSPPSNVTVNQSLGGVVFFGLNGITASGSQNNVTAQLSNVIFNTGNLPSSAIEIGGNAAVTASYPLVTTLDFGGSQNEGLVIQKLQAAGLVGGTLTFAVSAGSTIAQGTVILTPAMMTPAIGGINFGNGLTVTLEDFTAGNPVTVGTAGNQANVNISGALQFTGSTNAILNIPANLAVGMIVNGSLTSSGSLTINDSSNFSNFGQVSAQGPLTINLAATFQNGQTMGKSAVNITGQTVIINSISSQPLAVYGIGTIVSSAGTTISSPAGLLIGQQNVPCQQAITGAATIVTSSLITAPHSFIHAHPLIVVGTPLTSLDLTDPSVVSEITAEQAQGLLGGKLTVSQGVVTGGTLVLQPGNLANLISAEDIPSGVKVTFNNFASGSPIDVVITAASTASQVIVNGQEQFNNPTVVSINSDQAGGAFYLGTTGSIIAGKLLDISANGGMTINGSLSGSITLLASGSATVALNGNVQSGAGSFNVVTTGSGGISQASGKTIYAAGVTLATGGGDIGSPDAPLSIAAAELSLNAASGNVFIDTTKASTLYGTGGNTVQITAGNNLTIAGAIISADLNISGAAGENAKIVLAANIGENGGTTSIAASGSGSIVQTSGVVSGSDVTLGSLLEKGSIGSGSRGVDSAASSTLTLISSGRGSIYDDNDNSVTLNNSQSGGSIFLVDSSGLVVNNVQTMSGSITLAAGGGMLKVNPGAQIIANAGSVTLQNAVGGSIALGNGSVFHGFSTGGGRGAVNIFIGLLPKIPVRGDPPDNVVTSESAAFIYFGAGGIVASSPNNFVNADGDNVIFSSGSGGASAIDLQGNVTITAGKNQPVSYADKVVGGNQDDLIVDTGDAALEEDMSVARR